MLQPYFYPFALYLYFYHLLPYLPSFPTRRSSDLYVETLSPYARQFLDQMERPDVDSIDGLSPAISIEQKTTNRRRRSEEHTSELQSPDHLVCRLLLEKKKYSNRMSTR